MKPPPAPPHDEDEQAATATLHTHGYRVRDIQSLAHDQQPFAVRITPRRHAIAAGVLLESATMDLGEGCFTNVHTLRAHPGPTRTDVVSATGGFHLRDHVRPGAAIAAVSGSFSFISDDPAYQPAEPCLDFCCRTGETVSLPTATKPALLTRDGRPTIETLNATGTLTLDGRSHTWIGSKTPPPQHRPPGTLTVFGAANCRVLYRDHPRTGFHRHVERTSNTTPPDATAVDHVVAHRPGDGLRVISVRPGGGADLFAGTFVLRAHHPWTPRLNLGTAVEITRVDGHDTHRMDSGVSLGPSVADAADGHTRHYHDGYLGQAPFRDRRCARTLVGIHDGHLVLQVLDGAPKAEAFRGATPRETAEICRTMGLDPRNMYHLDGGASSKIAYLDHGTTRVFGSMHYLKWPTTHTEPFRWQGLDGRVLRSALVLRADQEEQERR